MTGLHDSAPHTIFAEGVDGKDTVVIYKGDELFIGGPNDVALVEVIADQTIRVKIMPRDEYDELQRKKEAAWAMRRQLLAAEGRVAETVPA